ncbi:MAG TPA: hypothetical protein VFN10_01885 [Thermoanaerobaculia bacterium]|nr:hypothetical protein [Thermoanaerobaculia bacterium]
MRKVSGLLVAVLFLVASVSFAPSAKATGCSDIFTTYYDCALNEVGSHWVLCSGGSGGTGQQSGAFREVETDPSCCGGTPTVKWYQWNGSSWVLLSGQPTPTC